MIDLETPEFAVLKSRLPSEADLSGGVLRATRLAEAWNLDIEGLLPGATNCLVLKGMDHGSEVVLRVPLCEEESGSGYEAQLAFSGRGGVTVLRHDPASGSTLMPLLRPGVMLHEAGLSAEEEVRVCCTVIRDLRADATPRSMTLEDWYEPFLRVDRAENISDQLLHQAQGLADQLLRTTSSISLRHGDLHHFNLLSQGDQWVAIDPKGVLGELAFEPAAFLRNPIGISSRTDFPEIMVRRIKAFADELGLSARRIWSWGVAQNTLSAWWDEPNDRLSAVRIVEALLAVRANLLE